MISPWQRRHASKVQANIMTKAETKELAKTLAYGNHLGADYVARALSAMWRAARTTRSQNAIMAAAVAAGVTKNPEFLAG